MLITAPIRQERTWADCTPSGLSSSWKLDSAIRRFTIYHWLNTYYVLFSCYIWCEKEMDWNEESNGRVIRSISLQKCKSFFFLDILLQRWPATYNKFVKDSILVRCLDFNYTRKRSLNIYLYTLNYWTVLNNIKYRCAYIFKIVYVYFGRYVKHVENDYQKINVN